MTLYVTYPIPNSYTATWDPSPNTMNSNSFHNDDIHKFAIVWFPLFVSSIQLHNLGKHGTSISSFDTQTSPDKKEARDFRALLAELSQQKNDTWNNYRSTFTLFKARSTVWPPMWHFFARLSLGQWDTWWFSCSRSKRTVCAGYKV